MKILIALVVATVSMGFMADTAHADENKGLYAGVGLGQFYLEIDDINDAINAAQKFDSDDSSWKAFVGWRFNPYLALELDYIDFGGPKEGDTTVEITGFAPYLVGTLPLGFFELFAQVGYYVYDYKLVSNSLPDVDDSSEDLVYGGGLGLVFFDHINARLYYEIFDAGEADNANSLWLTGAWRF